jgi:DNA-binding response OmpR family regulator
MTAANPRAAVRPRILVVDDSATSCLTLQGHLASAFEVHVARDGEDGVRRALELRPDLILMDVMMPVMDGRTACAVLRQRRETAQTPIILVTSRAEEADVEAGWLCGCTDYVLKPVDFEELLAKIDSWITPSAATAEDA